MNHKQIEFLSLMRHLEVKNVTYYCKATNTTLAHGYRVIKELSLFISTKKDGRNIWVTPNPKHQALFDAAFLILTNSKRVKENKKNEIIKRKSETIRNTKNT